MQNEPILKQKKGHVGIMVLNRPGQLNTFTSELAMTLCGDLIEMENDPSIRVVVIRGEGEAFCCGVDIGEFHGKTQKEYREWVSLMQRMIHIIATMKKPVIASAQGYAVANGTGIIAACDLAVVSEDLKMGATAVNVGLFCMGPAVPLSRSVGRKRCLEMLLTGDLIDAGKAEAWGLVNRVVPRDRLEEETLALAEKLAGKSPTAIQMGKEAFYGMSDMEFRKAMNYTNEVFASLCVTEDAQEGVTAFLESREPEWKGR